MHTDIFEYENDQKAMLVQMQEFKTTLGDIMPLKMQERSYYADFSKFLSV